MSAHIGQRSCQCFFQDICKIKCYLFLRNSWHLIYSATLVIIKTDQPLYHCVFYFWLNILVVNAWVFWFTWFLLPTCCDFVEGNENSLFSKALEKISLLLRSVITLVIKFYFPFITEELLGLVLLVNSIIFL